LRLILFWVLLIMLVGVATALEVGENARIWVNGGGDTITYVGKVASADENEVVLEATQSTTQYTERSMSDSYKYEGQNPVTIRMNAVVASRPEPDAEKNAAAESPGFEGILAAVGLVYVGMRKRKIIFLWRQLLG
jgi:hypothetical protein